MPLRRRLLRVFDDSPPVRCARVFVKEARRKFCSSTLRLSLAWILGSSVASPAVRPPLPNARCLPLTGQWISRHYLSERLV